LVRTAIASLAAVIFASIVLGSLGILNALQKRVDVEGKYRELQAVVMEKKKPKPKPPSKNQKVVQKPRVRQKRMKQRRNLGRRRNKGRAKKGAAPRTHPVPRLLRNINFGPGEGIEDGPEIPVFEGDGSGECCEAGAGPEFPNREYSESEVDSPPVLLSLQKTVYPGLALREEIEGYVVVEFVVDTKGAVRGVSIIRSIPRGIFDRSVIRALHGSTYRPALSKGKPVNCRCRKTFRFVLWE
jgi:protein TonB